MKCGCGKELVALSAYKQNEKKVITIMVCPPCGTTRKVESILYTDKNEQMVGLLKTKLSGGLMANLFSDMLNVMGFRGEVFFKSLSEEDETIRELFTQICLLWIAKLNQFDANNSYDGRNEFSVKTGRKIWLKIKSEAELFAGKEIFDVLWNNNESKDYYSRSTDLSFELAFVLYFSREHRTLQQTFTGLVFDWLMHMPTKEGNSLWIIQDKLTEVENEIPYFWNTLLI